MNKSIKILIKWVLGPLLGIWLFYSLYQQVKAQPDLDKAIALIKQVPFGADAWKFWLTIFLVFINWGLEAKKWQLLMKPLQAMNFLTAYKSVLCGVTFSLNTPNRIGEYGGRMLFVKEGSRIQSISLSVAGSIAQLIITLLMGCIGLAYLLITKNENTLQLGISFAWLKIFFFGSIAGTLVLLLFFFRFNWLVRLMEKIRFIRRFVKYINVLETFEAKILLRLLGLSLLRYVVFVLQYIFMLQLMQAEQNWWQSFWLVSVMFLVMSVIPSIAIAELGIRGKVATTLFAYSNNSLGVLAATFGIWFINLFIPAFAGSLLILGIKIRKEK